MSLAAFDAFTAFTIESRVSLALWAVFLGVKIWALVDAIIRRGEYYVATDKQNKAFWIIVLVVVLAMHILFQSTLMILNLIGCVVALVYLLDVRPTLKSMQRH
ncbi:MAG: DUF2516 family protein [Nocardioidaceae bacterium]